MQHKVIVLVGFRGSGKTEAAKFVQEEYGFFPVSLGIELKKLAVQRGIDAEIRDNLIELGDELRTQGGMGAVAEYVCGIIDGSDLGDHAGVVFEGVRTAGELEYIREHYGRDSVLAIGLLVEDDVRNQRIDDRGFQYQENGGNVVHEQKERAEGSLMNVPEALAVCDVEVANDSDVQGLRDKLEGVISQWLGADIPSLEVGVKS